MKRYRAVISSDWNQCLAPCGPFDYVLFTYPELWPALRTVFRQYTDNAITLDQAIRTLKEHLPAAITRDQMDAYLDDAFETYRHVPELVEWCLGRDILFMINTTGALGYFQRLFAKHLMPRVPVLSSYPHPAYDDRSTAAIRHLPLLATTEKGPNTQKIVREFSIPPDRVVLMGDSGGDGPHFLWGRQNKAFLIGSMTKASLKSYCRRHAIALDCLFGVSYGPEAPRDPLRESTVDFLDLKAVIRRRLERR